MAPDQVQVLDQEQGRGLVQAEDLEQVQEQNQERAQERAQERTQERAQEQAPGEGTPVLPWRITPLSPATPLSLATPTGCQKRSRKAKKTPSPQGSWQAPCRVPSMPQFVPASLDPIYRGDPS